MVPLPGGDGVHGDLGGQVVGEVELPGGDAAEGHAGQPVFLRQGQAGPVAAGQQGLVPLGYGAGDDGPHGVQDVPAGEVIARGELGLAGGLLVPLAGHKLGAGLPRLHAGGGVDGVVDAPVAGDKAPQHLAVGGVDDGVHRQGGDVPLPEVLPRLPGGEVGQAGDGFFRQLCLEKGVLNRQHRRGDGVRGPGVHQGPEEAPPVPRAPGDGDVLPAGALSQQGLEEEVQPFFLGHGGRPPFRGNGPWGTGPS